MNLEERGQLFESQPITFATGTFPLDLRFLDDAMSRFEAPVVREIIFRFAGSITGGTGGAAAKDFAKIFKRVILKDRGGEFYNLPGSIMRVVEQVEYGDGAQVDSAAIAGAATDTAVDQVVRCIFDPPKSANWKDYGVPLLHLVRGGSCTLQLQAPPAITSGSSTVNSGTVQAYVRVQDERKRRLKARMVWREQSMTAAEQTFDINGSLRAALLTSDLATAGYTALSGQTTFTSKTLQYASFPTSILWKDYRRQSAWYGDLTRDEVALFNAIPYVVPGLHQRIGTMMDLRALHTKLASLPTTPTLATCTIEDRAPDLAAEWMGFPSVGALSEALEKHGRVDANGNSKGLPLAAWDSVLRRRLPVEI